MPKILIEQKARDYLNNKMLDTITIKLERIGGG
jgi:hypothetical protein